MADESNALGHIRIQIATPSMDSKYEREYVKSLDATFTLLDHFGAKVDWVEMPGCADLAAARAKIFSYFQRSDFTHLLMIDSDMGWEAGDVIKLIMSERDFVAGVGMKKLPHVEFAYSNSDDLGTPLQIMMEADTGIIEVSDVGAAFVLITKACADKMVEAYPETKFVISNEQPEYAVFDPIIVPNTTRRLPEDFAFCYRWRKIGGKVFVIPSIRLQHVGRHVWTGALSDHAIKPEVVNG